jgi:hypothetical protein
VGNGREAQLADLRAWWARYPKEVAKAARRREQRVARWPDLTVIRTDTASVDVAIMRALALAVEGILCGLEVVNNGADS